MNAHHGGDEGGEKDLLPGAMVSSVQRSLHRRVVKGGVAVVWVLPLSLDFCPERGRDPHAENDNSVGKQQVGLGKRMQGSGRGDSQG